MTNSAKVTCNGRRVRELRAQQSMTQEKLAAMSKVDARTIQRAEQDSAVQLETLASLAATLGVTVSEISMQPGPHAEPADDLSSDPQNAVVLRRTAAGKALLDIICDSFSVHLECSAEPTQENVDALTALVDYIEKRLPNPWETPMEAGTLTLAQRLRDALELTSKIGAVEKHSLAVFAGSYTARAQVPYYDMDEGCMLITSNQKFKPVKVGRISISSARVDRVTVKVADQWQEPQPPKSPPQNVIADDEIPF